eukprot:1154910-Pelagomonas_calceolata.AAC.1
MWSATSYKPTQQLAIRSAKHVMTSFLTASRQEKSQVGSSGICSPAWLTRNNGLAPSQSEAQLGFQRAGVGVQEDFGRERSSIK